MSGNITIQLSYKSTLASGVFCGVYAGNKLTYYTCSPSQRTEQAVVRMWPVFRCDGRCEGTLLELEVAFSSLIFIRHLEPFYWILRT